MYNLLISELIKLKRSNLLWLALAASAIPAPVKYARLVSSGNSSLANWDWFIKAQQEIMVFGMLFTVIIGVCFIFSMEYHYRTAAYVCTTPVSKSGLLAAKFITGLFLVILLLIVSFLSTLLFGIAAAGTPIPRSELSGLVESYLVMIPTYFSLFGLFALLSAVFRKYALSSAIIMGYIIMTYPFSQKFSIFITPFMLPSYLAMRITGSESNLFVVSLQKSLSTGVLLAVLPLLFMIPAALAFVYTEKTDA